MLILRLRVPFDLPFSTHLSILTDNSGAPQGRKTAGSPGLTELPADRPVPEPPRRIIWHGKLYMTSRDLSMPGGARLVSFEKIQCQGQGVAKT
jgi:hypothetical protein